jgi:Protein of unknown function (DUF2442)
MDFPSPAERGGGICRGLRLSRTRPHIREKAAPDARPDRTPMNEHEFPMVDVLKLRPLDGRKLWLRFTDGCEGVCDLSDFIEEGGPMVEPLRDADYFARALVEMGAPTWPNGFDLDPD